MNYRGSSHNRKLTITISKNLLTLIDWRRQFTIQGQVATLSLFSIQGYGGGLFLPFSDETRTEMTYGGGRYLYDTIKGADLSHSSENLERLVLDFNYAYNPSCAYNAQWDCPLSPLENRLPFSVLAGEQRFT